MNVSKYVQYKYSTTHTLIFMQAAQLELENKKREIKKIRYQMMEAIFYELDYENTGKMSSSMAMAMKDFIAGTAKSWNNAAKKAGSAAPKKPVVRGKSISADPKADLMEAAEDAEEGGR